MDDPLEGWPRRTSSPDEMNLIVQQELSNLKALKRLSIGASGAAAQDPDLPGLDFSEAGVTSPDHSGSERTDPSDNSPIFARRASITKQRSIKRERSAIRHIRRDSSTSSQDSGTPRPHIVRRDEEETRVSAADQDDINNIWVPAAVHPELAPNEWQAFVNEKMAEIRNSHEAQQQSRLSRHSSRLSHVVVAPEEYVDASAILDRRRRSSSGEKRRSILELSKDFVDPQVNPLQEEEAPLSGTLEPFAATASAVSPPLAERVSASDPEFGSPTFEAPRGATSLRRSTHRLHKPALRTTSSKYERQRQGSQSSDQELPEQKQQPAQHQHLPSHLHHQRSQDQQQQQHQLHHRYQRSRELPDFPSHAQNPGPSQQQQQQQQETHAARMRPPLSVSVVAAKAVAHTAEQPPSPSAATPSPNASVMLGYRRRQKKLPPTPTTASSRISPESPEANSPRESPSPPASSVPSPSSSSTSSSLASPESPESIPMRDPSRPSGFAQSTQRQREVQPQHVQQQQQQQQQPSIQHRSQQHVPLQSIQPQPQPQPQDQLQQPFSSKRKSHHEDESCKRRSDLLEEEASKGISKPAEEPQRSDRLWKWLDSPKSKEHKDSSASNAGSSNKSKDEESTKDTKKTFANFFKKLDTKKRDSKAQKGGDSQPSSTGGSTPPQPGTPQQQPYTTYASQQQQKQQKHREHHQQRSKDLSKETDTAQTVAQARAAATSSHTAVEQRRRGHARIDSRTSNDAFSKSGGGAQKKRDDADPDYADDGATADVSTTAIDIKLPYDIPAHQVSDRSEVMMSHRFPLHIERAIYRLSHMKLANPRRPLRQQVLLSNFMYAYLNVVNKSFQKQQLAQIAQQKQEEREIQSSQNALGNLEESQIAQLRRIETQSYEDGLYARDDGIEEESSSSSEEEYEHNSHISRPLSVGST